MRANLLRQLDESLTTHYTSGKSCSTPIFKFSYVGQNIPLSISGKSEREIEPTYIYCLLVTTAWFGLLQVAWMMTELIPS